jgi:hypothetical protein
VSDPLREELKKLARLLKASGVTLLIGGGYGLVLRGELVRLRGKRTRFPEPPLPRSTPDVDCFLTLDVIADASKTQAIAGALDGLGYNPVEAAKYYQFCRELTFGGQRRLIKFDFHAAPVPDAYQRHVTQDERRIRPHGFKKFHAHTTPEALAVANGAVEMNIGDSDDPVIVLLPHPFSCLILKLFALRDQLHDRDRQYGRHHAVDIYNCLGMMTEQEWAESQTLRESLEGSDVLHEAKRIVGEYYSSPTSLGVIRTREAAEIADEKVLALQTDLDDLLNVS